MTDRYLRDNQIALEVWADDGQNEFNGIHKRTLDALARRGLVWYETNSDGRHTGGLTDKGRAVLAELEAAEASADPSSELEHTHEPDGEFWLGCRRCFNDQRSGRSPAQRHLAIGGTA